MYMFKKDVFPADFDVLTETNQLRRLYYSAQVSAQTQVYSLFLHSHYLMGWLPDTTRKKSGTVPTALRAQRLYDVTSHEGQDPNF